MENFQQLSDSALLAEINHLGNKVSYYECAEGTSYREEAPLRMAAKASFYSALAVARERGLVVETAGFLL